MNRAISLKLALQDAFDKHLKQKRCQILSIRNEDEKGGDDERRQDKATASDERAGKRDNQHGLVRY